MKAPAAWWKRLSDEEQEELQLFQAERARILKALLLLGWLMTTFFMALTLVEGRHFPWLPLVTDADLLALAFWVERRPQDHRWVSRLLLFPAVGLILLDAAGWPPDLLAPSLVFLPTLAYFAVLLDGPRSGFVMALLEAAGFLAYDAWNPLPGPKALVARSNMLLVVPGYLILGWVTWGRFRDLGRAVTLRAEALRGLAGECDRILAGIFRSLEEQVGRIRGLLRRSQSPPLPALREGVQAMTGLLRGFTERSIGLQDADPVLPLDPPAETARTRMITFFTDGILLFFLVGALRNLALFPARWPVILACVSILCLFRLALGRGWFGPRALPWAFACALFLSFLPSVHYWGRASLSPPLFVIPVFVIAVSLTGPVVLGLLALALYLAVVGWYVLSPSGWTQGQLYVLLYLGLLAPDLLAAGWTFWRLRLRRLESLSAQVEGHRRSLRMRRRLMGTLLHDMRNPLVVLASLAAERSPDPGPLRDMAERMADILQEGRALLDVEGLVPRHRLRPVSWGDLLEDIRALFASRLRDKGLGWEASGDPALRALALPDLLVNSVLANLLSNALKFSPRGSAITLEARERDGRFLVRVADRGPGLSPAQLASFQRGQRLTHSPGTEGEAGMGLGLFLSRDYARFMGGDLQLRSREGGGTEALLTLEAAGEG